MLLAFQQDMQSSCLCSHFLTILLISVVFKSVTAMRPPSPVTVNKCCDANQTLSGNEHQCVIGDNSSGDGNSSNSWWPLIVMTKKQTFYEPHGSAPRFMKFQAHQPTCENPDFYSGPHKLVLHSNGTLYLPERHKYIELENYCIDKDSAIVCDPNATIVRSKISLKKCCSQNAVYQTTRSTCAQLVQTLSFDSENNQSSVLDSSKYDVQYGFPMCENSKYFTFELNDLNIDWDSNQLVLKTGQTLAWNEFCLETVMVENETDSEYDMRVFICADHLSTAPNATVAIFSFIYILRINPHT